MGLKALTQKGEVIVKHVKKNDRVLVLVGRSKGKQARVLDVKPRVGKVLVEGVALVKHHEKPNPRLNVQGGIVEKESYINASNVMVVCPSCNKPTRVSHHELEAGKRVRSCKKCGATIDKS